MTELGFLVILGAMHARCSVSRLVLPALVALLFGARASAQVVVAVQEDRRATRLLFSGGFARPAELSIHYGTSTWRAAHSKLIKGEKPGHYRFGSGSWASLHNSVELRLGGKRVPASVWYLGLYRDAENCWHLSLMDAAKLHRTGLSSGSTRDAKHDLLVPLTRREDQESVGSLRVQLIAGVDQAKPAAGRLQLSWGPYQMHTDLEAALELGAPAGEPKFQAFDPDRVITTASGLRYQELRPGIGKSPSAASKVTVQYVGWNPDGKLFDSSFKRDQPSQFPLKSVIRGWTEGIALMKQGAIFRLEIPPELAYGKRGAGPIKPNSTLVFWVELLKFE